MEEEFGMTDFQFNSFRRDVYYKSLNYGVKAVKNAIDNGTDPEKALEEILDKLSIKETGMSLKIDD